MFEAACGNGKIEQIDDLLGLEGRLQIRQYSVAMRQDVNTSPGSGDPFDDRVYGLEFRLEW